MLALILSAALLPFSAFAPDAATRQDDEAPRYLDAKLVPTEGRAVADFVPRGWKLEGDEGEATGDLNKDGAPDKVLRLVEDVPVERPDGVYNTRYRALVVLLGQTGGGLKRAAVATRLLGCSLCAGALGDPEGGNITVEIKGGVLNVHQLSGSREATDLTQRFRYDAASGRFALIGQDVETYDRAEGNSDSVSTNYLTGVRVSKKFRVKKAGADPVVVSNKTTRLKPARRFIEDVDYEESFNE
jgi:opacity protein-like surface antigen